LEEGKEVMIMIIGGAYQGKLAFAKKIYPDVTWADGAVCTEEELYSCEGIYHFHQYI
jgi:adenosylcobinamide kinase / adenosylcobinamide-phosphate guanylyltransferase